MYGIKTVACDTVCDFPLVHVYPDPDSPDTHPQSVSTSLIMNMQQTRLNTIHPPQLNLGHCLSGSYCTQHCQVYVIYFGAKTEKSLL